MPDQIDAHITQLDHFWPDYWENFLHHCNDIAVANNWDILTTIDHELKPYGKYIHTSTRGHYLVWDHPKYHTMFLLRWA